MSRQMKQSKQTSTHDVTEQTDRSKMQTGARRPSSKTKFKQQRQQRLRQRRIENESPQNLDSFSLSITVRNIPNRIRKKAAKFEKDMLKIGHRSSRFLECAEFGYFTLLFYKERQRNEQ